jgi:hypothetical protein
MENKGKSIKDKFKNFIDLIFWGEPKECKKLFVFEFRKERVYNNFNPKFDDERVNKELAKWNSVAVFTEYFLELNARHIYEPDYGWVIYKKNVLKYSFNNEKMAKPSILKYLKYKYLGAYKTINCELAVSFRQHAESDFFHLFVDIIPRLWVLDDFERLFSNISIIISPALYNKDYFQFIIKNSFLKNYNFIIANPDTYVEAQKSYFLVPFMMKKSNLLRTAHLFDSIEFTPYNYKKVFVYRKPPIPRSLSNNKEVMELMVTNGFFPVNFDDIGLFEQIAIIKSAETLVFIHGAAITNIIFNDCHKNLSVFEIIPEDRICSEFYWMCCELEIKKHEIFVSDPLDNNMQTRIDLSMLQEKLNSFLT